MYSILWKDIEIVRMPEVLRPELMPIDLRFSGNRVDDLDFVKWLGTRVFQESRLDLDDLLKSLDLKEYDVLAIASKTKAILTGVDHYSVEWTEEEEDV